MFVKLYLVTTLFLGKEKDISNEKGTKSATHIQEIRKYHKPNGQKGSKVVVIGNMVA